MIIFPAIDIKKGKCVRLLKGDFNKITSYNKSPIDQATIFFKSGFKDIHIVDLDGALLGESKNSKIIKEIIKKVKLRIQIGGGIRNIDSINSWLEAGVDKVVMGTAVIENIGLLKNACEKFYLLKIRINNHQTFFLEELQMIIGSCDTLDNS